MHNVYLFRVLSHQWEAQLYGNTPLCSSPWQLHSHSHLFYMMWHQVVEDGIKTDCNTWGMTSVHDSDILWGFFSYKGYFSLVKERHFVQALRKWLFGQWGRPCVYSKIFFMLLFSFHSLATWVCDTCLWLKKSRDAYLIKSLLASQILNLRLLQPQTSTFIDVSITECYIGCTVLSCFHWI